jgi:hypothetical protein
MAETLHETFLRFVGVLLAPSWLDATAGLNKLELEIRQLNLFWVEFRSSSESDRTQF